MDLTPEEFAKQVRHWYDIYAAANTDYFSVEEDLTVKAQSSGHLELADLVSITGVLGNPHGISGRLRKNNTNDAVICATRNAMENLYDPAQALKSVRALYGWGQTYGSKTLRCMCPQKFGALDGVIMNGVASKYLPSRDSWHKYRDAIRLYAEIREMVQEPGPRENGEWYVADIEMALFQFLWHRANRLT